MVLIYLLLINQTFPLSSAITKNNLWTTYAQKLINQNDRTELIEKLVEENSPFSKKLLFRQYMNEKDYNNASQVLESLTALEDFYNYHSLLLTKIQNQTLDNLDNAETTALFNMMNKNQALSTKSALWNEALTKVIYEEPLPIISIANNNRLIESTTKSVVEVNKVKIYPNPTIDYINIEQEGFEQGTISIVNLLGQIVGSRLISNNSIQLDLTNYPTGLYFVILRKDNQKSIHKIILSR